MRLTLTLLILFSVSTLAFSNTTNISKKFFYSPHTYKVHFFSSFESPFQINWNDESDLDVAIYRVGSKYSQAVFQSREGYTQSFEYYPRTTGDYIIKINPWVIKQKVVCYDANVTVPGYTTFFFQNCFYKDHIQHSALLVGSKTSKVESINYTLDSSQEIAVEYYCLNDLGPFYPIINEIYEIPSTCSNRVVVLVKTYSLQRQDYFNLFLEIKQFEASPESDNQENSSSNVAVITLSLIGGVIAIVLIGIALCKWIKKEKKLGADSSHELQKDKWQIKNQSLQRLRKGESSTCPICLDQHCNARLGCNHYFHQNCIQEWVRKNNKCPMCRFAFRKSQIKRIN